MKENMDISKTYEIDVDNIGSLVGKNVRHFKGGAYKVLNLAMHTESKEDMVVYQSLSDFKVYVRPLAMFLEECSHEQYLQYGQSMRFEIDDSE